MLNLEQALALYGIERMMEADVVLTGKESEAIILERVKAGFQIQNEVVSHVNDDVAKKVLKDARKKVGKDDDKEKVDKEKGINKAEQMMRDYWLLEQPSKALFVIIAQPGSWEVQYKGRIGPDGEPIPRDTPAWYHWEVKDDGTFVVAISLYEGRFGQIIAKVFEYTQKYSLPDGTTTIK